MYLERFYDEKLAQASYLVGCQATGDALVVDANRDVEQYIEAAERQGLRIRHVTETHIHADYVSGTRELAQHTGATMYLSDEGGEDWRYGFADEGERLEDGDVFEVGRIRIEARHTPGHTPEHLSFLLTDTAGADRPMGVFSGDFVFVGDVGRPDLLEKAAKVAGTMEAAARELYASVRRFRELPDWLQVWPGHGAGSACGKALGAVPQSTLGYEKLFNWAFRAESEEAFVREVLSGQPEPPKYFAEMKRINRDGPSLLGGRPHPELLAEPLLEEALERGALVVDTRPSGQFAEGHVPGTISIPADYGSFTTWAGWLIPYDRDFYIIAPSADERGVAEVVRDLAMIGLDRVAGWFHPGTVAGWSGDAREPEMMREISTSELESRVREGTVELIDVRGQSEWDAGRIPGARHIPLGYLTDRLDEVPRDRPVALQCQSGARSAIGASLLRANGYRHVMNVRGGFGHWAATGRPVER